MPSLIYPKQELWKPEPFWQRWRNAAGERIRLDSGARMNDDECCCDTGDYGCSGCNGTGDNASQSVEVVISGVDDGVTDCGGQCSDIDGTYVLDWISTNTCTDGTGLICSWYLNITDIDYCSSYGLDIISLALRLNGGYLTLSLYMGVNSGLSRFEHEHLFGYAIDGSGVDCIDGSYTLNTTGIWCPTTFPHETYAVIDKCDYSSATCEVTFGV